MFGDDTHWLKLIHFLLFLHHIQDDCSFTALLVFIITKAIFVAMPGVVIIVISGGHDLNLLLAIYVKLHPDFLVYISIALPTIRL